MEYDVIVSSPTFLRLVSVGVELGGGDSLSPVGEGWEAPNAGDLYRLRGFALPPPCHR